MSYLKRSDIASQIADAFLQLMCEKPYEEITVTDIVNKADVGRASFYRNFESINDVLDYAVFAVIDDFARKALPTINSKNEREWRDILFQFIYQFCINTQALISNNKNNGALIVSRIVDHVEYMQRDGEFESVAEKYSTPAKLGLLSGVLRRWIDTGMKEPAEEIVNYLISLIVLI